MLAISSDTNNCPSSQSSLILGGKVVCVFDLVWPLVAYLSRRCWRVASASDRTVVDIFTRRGQVWAIVYELV